MISSPAPRICVYIVPIVVVIAFLTANTVPVAAQKSDQQGSSAPRARQPLADTRAATTPAQDSLVPLFIPPVFYPSGGGAPNSIAVADLNGDGKPDLVVGDACGSNDCPDGNDIEVLLSRGDGTFEPMVGYSSGGEAVALVGDVNGDGKPDIVTGGSVLLGNGDGTFQPAMFSPNSASGISMSPSISSNSSNGNSALADVNGDGKLDLLFAGGGAVSVLLGNGDGTFQSPVSYASGNTFAAGVVAADVNGDGKLDLVVASTGPTYATLFTVGVLLGNGDGTFQPVVPYYLDQGTGNMAISVADVNGDKRPDILVLEELAQYGPSASALAVLLNNGDGTFAPAVTYNAGGLLPEGIAVLDVNADGKPDVIVENGCNNRYSCFVTQSQIASVLLGNGDGTFQPAADYSSGQYPPEFSAQLAIADLNGDQKPDLVLQGCTEVGCPANQVAVILHVGATATTSTLASTPSPSVYGQVVTLTATVTSGSGTPAGSVIFYDGTEEIQIATLVNGTASTSTLFSLPAGSHSLTVVYQGSSEFSSSQSAPLMQLVNPATTSTSLVSTRNPAPIGSKFNYTATLSTQYGTSTTGPIVFSDNGSVVATVSPKNGIARYRTSYSVAGSHAISASYKGDSNNIGSTSPTLTEYIGATTSTSIASNLNPSIYGQSITWTAAVSTTGSVPPTGKVQFSWSGYVLGTAVLDASGVATISRSNLNADAYPVVARYKGDDNNAASTSVVLKQVVTQATSSATLTSSPNPSAAGQPVTFTATITSPTAKPTGPVTFAAGKAVLGTGQLSNGKAIFTTSTLGVGSTTVTATYNGDSDIAPSSASITVVVQ